MSDWLPSIIMQLPGGSSVRVTPATTSAGAVDMTFTAPAGLCRLSAMADARDFDWESLYFPLNLFKNHGQRTGPWDFDFRHGNQPLVPAYRITCDGRKLGMWFFQRVSLQDMAHKIFRGNMVVRLATDGPHVITLEPYHSQSLPMLQAVMAPADDLQPDHQWVDRIAVHQNKTPAVADLPMKAWNDPAFWENVQTRLQDDGPNGLALLLPRLEKTYTWAMTGEQPPKAALLPLVFKARLSHDPTAQTRAISLVESILALPYFGNPNPDGYAHNGDMAAAEQMLTLALSLTLLEKELSQDARIAIEKKIVTQAEIFIDTALVNDDYWGGSVLQDHGWRSYMLIATAMLYLPGVHLRYRHLLAFALGRVRRSIAAMPRDGVVPWTSYGYLNLYLDAAAQLRECLLVAGGIDLYDEGPWHEIIDYIHASTDRTGQFMLIRATNQDDPPLIGGLAFCLHMAIKHDDGKAFELARLIACRPAPDKYYCSPQAISHLHNPITALTENWPHLEPVAVDDATCLKPRLNFYADSGLVRHHDPKTDITFTFRCAPVAGWHAYQHAVGPCDRMHVVPDDGHFAILHHATSLLASTEHGYRLRTAARSCLLIDGQGQLGSVDYPMSLPSFQHPGQRIRSVTNDRIELELTRAYPKAAGVLAYTRQFHFQPDHTILCVDTIALRNPAKLTWLFHSRAEHGLTLQGLHFGVGTPAKLTLHPLNCQFAPAAQIAASIIPTDTVWSYDSCTSWAPISAVHYETDTKVTSACVTFAITCPPPC